MSEDVNKPIDYLAGFKLWHKRFMFLYHKAKDWYSWNHIFFRQSKKHGELYMKILKAQLFANSKGRTYYVIPTERGYTIMSSRKRKMAQAAGVINKKIGIIDMLRDSVYIAIPENLSYGGKIKTRTVKTE